ncbi:hypothetical protein ACHAWO_005883 [Cyclotella atomus]|uniref:Uncharacterized protein n=1 Tax=Cyclotella atomus TaxID=382360 RepID=A0ABD3PAB8_9STRA
MVSLSLILTVLPAATALRGSPRNTVTQTRVLSDISDPSHCYPLIHASASPDNTLDNKRYYYFVDSMSNSYFSSSNYTTYDALPTEVKYSFVTLSCQCQLRGEGEDCCLANNAVLDSTGSDPDGPPPSEEQEAYLNDVCTTTAGAIGDNVAPGTGELPVSGAPSVTPGGNGGDGTDNTPAPTVLTPEVVGPDGSGETDNNREVTDGGMSGGAWAGIAIAGAAGLTMILYLIMRKEGEEEEVELDENADVTDVRKERNASGLMVKTDSGDDNGPISPSSTMDATQSITEAHSDVSSLPSSIGMSKSGEVGEGYNDLNLLPRPEDESVLSGDEESYFYNNNGTSSLAAMGVASGAIVGMGVTSTRDDDESSISSKSHSSSVLMEDAMPASNKSALPPQHYTPGELDQAIENGNWEAVAASAAAIVNQGVSKSMSSDSERGVV